MCRTDLGRFSASISSCTQMADYYITKKTSVLHRNSSAGSSIKQTKDDSYVFGSSINPFFCFPCRGSAWQRLVEQLCQGQTLRVSLLCFLRRLFSTVTKLKHSRMYRLLQTSFVGCLRFLKSDVVETLRPFSARFRTNDVALDYPWLMMKKKKCVGEKHTMTCGRRWCFCKHKIWPQECAEVLVLSCSHSQTRA